MGHFVPQMPLSRIVADEVLDSVCTLNHFIPTVANRGAAITQVRKLYSAAVQKQREGSGAR